MVSGTQVAFNTARQLPCCLLAPSPIRTIPSASAFQEALVTALLLSDEKQRWVAFFASLAGLPIVGSDHRRSGIEIVLSPCPEGLQIIYLSVTINEGTGPVK